MRTGASKGPRPGFRAGLTLGFLLAVAVAVSTVSLLTCGRGPDSKSRGAAVSDSTRSDSERAREEKELAHLVIARVGKRTITPADLATKIRVQYPQMANLQGIAEVRQKWEVLKAMVDQYCWVEVGERRGLDKDEDFRETLELSRKFILSNHTVAKLVYDKAKATDEEIEAYYRENPDQYHTVARNEVSTIVVKTRAEAEHLRDRVLAGEDFSALASHVSTDDLTRQLGGAMGTVTLRSDLRSYGERPELNQRLMDMPVGQVSEPIQTSLGWSLFLVTSHIPEGTQPLEEVKEGIRKRLETKKANEVFSSTLDEVKKETGAEIDQDAWLQYTFSMLNEEEIFQMAQGEKKPSDRIRLYQGLVDRYPEGARAPQALFMVGFTYADDLGDFAKARQTFQDLLQKYPQSELTASANWMLENMEKNLNSLPYAQEIKRKAEGG